MSFAISEGRLIGLKNYADNLKEGSFHKSEVREFIDNTDKTNDYIETAKQLMGYYVSLWGTNIGNTSPGELASKLSQGTFGQKIGALSMSSSMISKLVDKYLEEKKALFDKQIDSLNGHDVQKLVRQILAEL